jgi:hypothetical protein
MAKTENRKYEKIRSKKQIIQEQIAAKIGKIKGMKCPEALRSFRPVQPL